MPDKNQDVEVPVITLTFEDDTEMEWALLAVFPVGEREYAAMVPVDQIDDEDGDIFLFRYQETGEDELEISKIEDDDEFNEVSEEFYALLDEDEFNTIELD